MPGKTKVKAPGKGAASGEKRPAGGAKNGEFMIILPYKKFTCQTRCDPHSSGSKD